MTRKRIVWKDDYMRWKSLETKRDVAEELRVDWQRKSYELTGRGKVRSGLEAFWKGRYMKCYAEETD